MVDKPDPAELDLIPIQFIVTEHFDGWRLDHFIRARIPRLSRNRVQKMLRAQVLYNGEVFRPSQRVRRGQQVVLLRPAPDEPDVPRRYDVVYEDDDLLAINKPSGLPVHSTARFFRNTLTAVLRERFEGRVVPRPCHRLDRETSGLMLLAHSKAAERGLKVAFFKREIRKRYLALCWGDPGEEGVIDAPIGPHPESGIRIKMRTYEQGDPRAQPARTRYRTLERRGDCCLVEAAPETGRQHQIRLHLSSIGAPIVGDKLYGPDPALMLEYLETGWSEHLAARLVLPRHALHASQASFVHPTKGEEITICCPLTEDLQAFWDSLGSEGEEGTGE